MKDIFTGILLLLLFTGCEKNKACTAATPASEEARIIAFAQWNNMPLMKLSNGIYFQIMSPGSGQTPMTNSEVTVGYVGKFIDGTIFDQNSRVKNHLTNFIEGWKIGLPLIQKGGTIKLIIPSAYAYGCTSYANIPPNSILYYEINLIDVQ